MSRVLACITLSLMLWVAGDAAPASNRPHFNSAGFPQTVRVRLWYLHPPTEMRLKAEPSEGHLRKCATCVEAAFSNLVVRASNARVVINGEKPGAAELSFNGHYKISPSGGPPIAADFPVQIRASAGHLLVTATMPMEEYIAGVLAGEAGNFKSDEALKAIAVAARTYAMHFGSRHEQEGFDFCDTTHCQDLRAAGINDRLRHIAESTAGEILWYNGEPASTYYHANCGGTTEDAHYLLGNNEAPAPFLLQHADPYCVRDGGSKWHTEVTTHALQRALVADGIPVPGRLRSVNVLHRTPSGRVEFLRITGTSSITVPAMPFRFAIGRHIGWERLKSNWYEVTNAGDRIVFNGRGSGHGVGLCQVGAEVMGEEGHSYGEILGFYYPGTKLGVNAQAVAWQRLANEDIELLTTRPERDRTLLPLATRIVHESEATTGLKYRDTPRLKVYATVAAFRDSTGEPGWIAASTRGRTIHLQPPDVLQQAGTLEATLHHELLHILVESYAKAGTPIWFREGLVLYLNEPDSSAAPNPRNFNLTTLDKTLRSARSEGDLRQAYENSRAYVAQLGEKHGKKTLLSWLQNGLPQEVRQAPAVLPQQAP